MKENELNFYNEIGNWDFSQIKYVSENFTDWDYLNVIKENLTSESVVLDLGTADGMQIFKHYPKCKEILGTDFSDEMVKTAIKNSEKFKRDDVHFRVMDNLDMNTEENYFDVVTARHTITDKKGIYKTLKDGGKLILRGVDKLDCWNLKMMFGQGQAYNDEKPVSQRDYEELINAGFKDVELIPIHIIEYYETKEDLLALLLKTPIVQDENWNNKKFDINVLDNYIMKNTTEKGIKLIRRYYGIVAVK